MLYKVLVLNHANVNVHSAQFQKLVPAGRAITLATPSTPKAVVGNRLEIGDAFDDAFGPRNSFQIRSFPKCEQLGWS